MTLFFPSREESKLCLRAEASIVGAKYRFLLRYEAAFEEFQSILAADGRRLGAGDHGARRILSQDLCELVCLLDRELRNL